MANEKKLLSEIYPDLDDEEISPAKKSGKVLLSDLYEEDEPEDEGFSFLQKLASGIRGVSQLGLSATAYSMLPDYRPETADVSFGDRTKVESLVGRADERKTALESQGYKNVTVEGGRVYVDGKEFDPSTLLSGSELVHEAIANSPMLLELQPGGRAVSTALKMGGTALGAGSLREIIKHYTFPDLEPNPGDAVIEGAAAGLSGAASGIFNKGSSVVDDIVDSSGNIINKATGASGELVTKAKPVVSTFTKKTVNNISRNMFGKEASARELGATTQYLKEFGVKPITHNVEEASKLSSRFVEEVVNEPHILSKRDAVLDIWKEAGGKVRNFYDQYKDQVSVKLGDILSSEPYTNLIAQGKSLRHAPKVKKQVSEETKAVFEYLMEAAIPDEALRSKILTYEPEAFKKAIDKIPIDIGSLWDVRMGLDDLAKWGSNIDDTSKAAVAAVRSGADAIRQSVRKGIISSNLDASVKKEFADASDLFHQVTPIAEMIDTAAASQGGVSNFTKILWNQLSGQTRRGVEFAQKTANRPSARAFFRSMYAKLSPDTIDKSSFAPYTKGVISNMYDKSKNVIGDLASPISELLPENSGQAIRSALLKDSGKRVEDMGTPTDLRSLDINLQDMERIAPPAPVVLPRDPELIASNPQALEELTASLSPDAARLFKNAIASKDPMKLRLATLSAMSEVPDLFEPSVTGNQSEIRVGEGFVLADPMEAQVYKKSLRAKYSMGLITRTFLAKQLSSLNNLNDMRLFPPAEGFPKTKEQEKDTRVSPLLGVRKRAIRTLVGERNAHDY